MSKSNRIAQSAMMISTFTLMSKVLGFVREMLIAAKYGSGYETDTYFVAMTATTMIMTTIGSALNTSLVPVFTEVEERRGRKAKLKFLNNIFNVVFFISLIIAILDFFISPLIIKIVASGFEGEQFQLAVKLNRIGLPIVVFLGFTYVFSGFLHSSQVFGPPAIMGLPYNLVFIIFLLFMAHKENIHALMIVSVLASSTQFLIQLPAVWHRGFRYRLDVDFRDIYIQKTLTLVLPVLLGSAVQQINTIVDKTLASGLVEGSISALSYSAKINDVVVSVFIAAITTVIFPMLSRAFSQGDNVQVKQIMSQGINIILLITVPATVGIMVLARPIVSIFFERGHFTPNDTIMTSQALFCYSLGLVGISLRLMLNKVFYSLQDTKTPMINGALAVGLNIILNLIFVRFIAHAGLALATSISTTFTSVMLFINLRKKIGSIGLKGYIRCLTKTLIAAMIMGAVVYFTFYGLTDSHNFNRIFESLILLLSVGLGAIVYFVLCILLRVKELKVLIGGFGRMRS
jgi:putative peptidoglycan lipid II flippase